MRQQHLMVSGKTEEETALILDMLEAVAEPVNVRFRLRPLSQDADDDMILDLAISGRANAIVTANTKHFREAAPDFGIEVMTPQQLLLAIQKEGH